MQTVFGPDADDEFGYVMHMRFGLDFRRCPRDNSGVAKGPGPMTDEDHAHGPARDARAGPFR